MGINCFLILVFFHYRRRQRPKIATMCDCLRMRMCRPTNSVSCTLLSASGIRQRCTKSGKEPTSKPWNLYMYWEYWNIIITMIKLRATNMQCKHVKKLRKWNYPPICFSWTTHPVLLHQVWFSTRFWPTSCILFHGTPPLLPATLCHIESNSEWQKVIISRPKWWINFRGFHVLRGNRVATLWLSYFEFSPFLFPTDSLGNTNDESISTCEADSWYLLILYAALAI